ncbi:MAG: hypothetical protein HXY22_10655 [Alphaproteobacteria bacterium]|nr:hypothetical protein [Alphaproteobacteria bacterium]
MSEDWIITLVALAASAGIFAFSTWKAGRPSDPLNISLINYNYISLLAIVAFLLAVAHVITLVTGTPFRGRW